MPTNNNMDKLCYLKNGELYSSELQLHSMAWVNLNTIMLVKRNKQQKNRYNIININNILFMVVNIAGKNKEKQEDEDIQDTGKVGGRYTHLLPGQNWNYN